MGERSLESIVSPALVEPGHTLVDRYDLGPMLGRGGMADVYRATDLLLKREVAVKVLRQPGLTTTDYERFMAEARTLARLSHPALVTLLDVSASDDCTFLVMELVDGAQLSRASNPADVLAIGQQLADVLAYLHDQGVVHRDIKPGNVLRGDDGRVRLADFGIARVLGELTPHTATGFTMGTAAYVAPEQLLGGDVTGATDVYALGLLLIEYLSGTPAFQGTAAEVASARLASPPTLSASVPDEWKPLLADMTAIDPRERPNASEVHGRLATMAGVPPTPASAETVVLKQTQTRPLTMPIPVVDVGAEEAPADGRTDQLRTSHLTEDIWRTSRHYLTRWTQFSTRGQLICLAVLVAIALACIAIVASSAGDGQTGEPPAPDVPGKVGRQLQQLHEAVYP